MGKAHGASKPPPQPIRFFGQGLLRPAADSGNAPCDAVSGGGVGQVGPSWHPLPRLRVRAHALSGSDASRALAMCPDAGVLQLAAVEPASGFPSRSSRLRGFPLVLAVAQALQYHHEALYQAELEHRDEAGERAPRRCLQGRFATEPLSPSGNGGLPQATPVANLGGGRGHSAAQELVKMYRALLRATNTTVALSKDARAGSWGSCEVGGVVVLAVEQPSAERPRPQSVYKRRAMSTCRFLGMLTPLFDPPSFKGSKTLLNVFSIVYFEKAHLLTIAFCPRGCCLECSLL